MEQYNADELVAPAWLNETFFKQVLDKNSPEANYKIFELNIAPASQKGDHYASIMFRVKLVYGNSESSKLSNSMIVKTLPPVDTEKGAVLSDVQIFQTELKMYETLIPRFEQEWQRCGEEIKFAGKMLYHSLLTPQPVIVLEDLCTIGYDVLRERSFSYDEVKLCLHKLARWHAVSFKLTQQLPADNDIMQLQHGLFKSNSLMNTDYISNGMTILIAALEEASGFEQFLPKLRKLAPQLIERCVGMNDAYARGVRGPIYVLTHGDFHGRNIMVKRKANESSFDDLLFIDFQLCFYGPACYDLIYTSFTFFNKQLRESSCNELFTYYFDQFTASLAKLGVPKPSWPSLSDFQADFKRWSCLDVFMAATFLPLAMLGEPPIESDTPFNLENLDMDKLFSSSEYRKRFYMRASYLKHVKELLTIYLEAGYLD